MNDATAPLLKMLRELMGKKGLNTAALADAAQIERVRLRRVLSGSDPMTVAELLALGQALELGPADLGWANMPEEPVAAPTPHVAEEGEDPDALGLDPWGNQPMQLFRAGFELGCDFMFVAAASDLDGSGVPAHVLAQFNERDLPIKLDAHYHRYNSPRYDPGGVTITLSFDALYDCRFPWSAIKQVLFFPAAPDVSSERPTDEPPDEPKRPTLRLVT